MSDPTEPPYGSGTDNLWSDSYRKGPYTIYEIVVSYPRSAGVLHLPVAAPPVACGDGPQVASVFIGVSAPIMRKVVSWTARRQGLPVEIPPSEPTDPNLVLLSDNFTPQAPLLDADGNTYWYRASGIYTYGLVRPLCPADGFSMGSGPYNTTPLGDNVYRGTDFQAGII